MAVPSSGSISMQGIFSEKNENDYAAANIDGESGLSLRGLSSNSYSDTSSGGNINLNTSYASTASGGANLVNSPYAMSEFRGYNHDEVTVDTTFQIKSGYEHFVQTMGGRRSGGYLTRFSKGFNAPNITQSPNTTPAGAIDSATNIGVSSVIGTVTQASHNSFGPGGETRIRLRINAGSDSNSGFTTASFTQTALSNTASLSRTAATYSYSSGIRTWLWSISSSDSAYSSWNYSSAGTQSGFTSKIFGDASSGNGTDANFRTTIVLS